MHDPNAVTLVEARDLSAGYGTSVVLEDVEFDLRSGERMAVLGPNGGGKSTLFRLLLGELEPFAGRLTWAGEPGELGLPESVPDYFGGEFRRRIEALVRREGEAEARRLRTAAAGPREYDEGMRRPSAVAARGPDGKRRPS
jgi:ATPase subunit of ABC transporter with duplicated ATPase domains